MKKRIISFILILCMTLVLIPAAGSKAVYAADTVDEFPDATESVVNTTAYKSIYWAVGEGIINGFSDGTFGPDDSCTRAQFVVMVWRLSGKPDPESTSSAGRFSDVSGMSGGMLKAISWAVEEGIISGFNDGTFRPDDKVTRRQSAVMLWRLAGKPKASEATDFSDISSSESTYPAIQWGAAAGLIKGFSDGSFGPEQDCLRQQIVIFMYRYADKVEEREMVIPEIKKVDGGEVTPAEPEEPEKPEKVIVYLVTKESKTMPTDTGSVNLTVNYEYDDAGKLVKAYSKNTVIELSTESNGDTKLNITFKDDAGALTGTEVRIIGPADEYKSSVKKDASGKVIEQTEYKYDSHGNQIEYNYYSIEGANNKTVNKITYSGDLITQIIEEADGNVVSKRLYEYYPDGVLKKESMLDEKGNPVAVSEFNTSGAVEKSEYFVDGKVISATTYKYDSNGNMTEQKDTDGDGNQENRYTYKYDSKGYMTEVISYNGADQELYRHVTTFNSDGLIESEVDYYNNIVNRREDYEYKDGVLIRVKHTYDDGTSNYTEYSYDENGNPKKIVQGGWIMEYEYKAFEQDEAHLEDPIPDYVRMYFPMGAW